MKTLLYIWFFGVHGRYIRVMDLFTNVYSSINVPELIYIRLIIVILLTGKGDMLSSVSYRRQLKPKNLGHILPLVIYDLFFMHFLMVFPRLFFGTAGQRNGGKNLVDIIDSHYNQPAP
jgi:hypothetical protein